MRQTRGANSKGLFPIICILRSSKAQSTLEYAMIIVCFVAALAGMRLYITRGMQGRLRQSADQLGPQYDPNNTRGNLRVSYNSTTITNVTTLSEEDLKNRCESIKGTGRCTPADWDLNGDGYCWKNVTGAETITSIPSDNPAITIQTGNETVEGL